jgi:Cu(I)-responsive transcriptional regulator
MRIGELAQATGTKAETIRYYEREGILPLADRTNSNYRDYSPAHLATLTFIRRARELGFSMAQVRQLLALSDHADKPCQDVDLMVRDQLAEVEEKIADLTQLRRELAQMLRSCQSDRIGECRIVESLGRRRLPARDAMPSVSG